MLLPLRLLYERIKKAAATVSHGGGTPGPEYVPRRRRIPDRGEALVLALSASGLRDDEFAALVAVINSPIR
jgi:hypothetical protein